MISIACQLVSLEMPNWHCPYSFWIPACWKSEIGGGFLHRSGGSRPSSVSSSGQEHCRTLNQFTFATMVGATSARSGESERSNGRAKRRRSRTIRIVGNRRPLIRSQIQAQTLFVVAKIGSAIGPCWRTPDHVSSKCDIGRFDDFGSVDFFVTLGR